MENTARFKKINLYFTIIMLFVMIISACQPAQPAAAPVEEPAAEVAAPTEAPAQEAAPTEAPAAEPTAEPVVEDPALKTLVIAVDTDPANLEPGTNNAYPIGSEMIINIFDTLIAWTPPDFTTLEGRLAESWEVSEDGITYTFKLRDGVKFHDGTPVDAEAVKFSFERTFEINPYMKAYFGHITAMNITDPLTLEIVLDAPLPVFLSWLAMPQAAVVSPAGVEKFGDTFNVNPVGSGPFIFESYTADTEVVLKGNPDYWRGAPQLETIVYRVIPDAATRRLEIENGTIDISQQNGQLYSVPVEDIKVLKQNPDIEVIELPSQIIRQFEFNNSAANSVTSDVRLRQAFCYAIDYDGLVNELLGGTASRVYGPLPTNSWGFNPKIQENAFVYDPEKAKSLIAETGLTPEQLTFDMPTFQGSLWADIGTFLQANFADVGITVNVVQTEFPILREQHTTGNFEIALQGRQPWYNDPDAHITIGYLSSLRDSAMTFRMPEDAELDQMILDAQSEVDFETRKAMYFTIQEKIQEKVPGCFLFSNIIIIYKRANVQGLVVNSAPPLNEYWSVYKTAQ